MQLCATRVLLYVLIGWSDTGHLFSFNMATADPTVCLPPESFNEGQRTARKPGSGPTIKDYLRSLAYSIVCGLILYYFNVHGVMLNSKKIYHTVLYASYGCYVIFTIIGAYMTWALPNDDWERTHMHLIYCATASAVLGGILWTIAVFPVFHIWTFPLGFVALFFVINVLTLIPALPKRKRE